jgi:hypothetical protein
VEFQTLINWGIGLIAFLGGWILKSLKETSDEQRKDLLNLTDKVQRVEVLVAGTYVKRDDMDKLGDAIFHKLDRIESKLDQKADK